MSTWSYSVVASAFRKAYVRVPSCSFKLDLTARSVAEKDEDPAALERGGVLCAGGGATPTARERKVLPHHIALAGSTQQQRDKKGKTRAATWVRRVQTGSSPT